MHRDYKAHCFVNECIIADPLSGIWILLKRLGLHLDVSN